MLRAPICTTSAWAAIPSSPSSATPSGSPIAPIAVVSSPGMTTTCTPVVSNRARTASISTCVAWGVITIITARRTLLRRRAAAAPVVRRQLADRPPAAHGARLLGHDVAAAARAVVDHLHQDPAPRPRLGQREAAPQLVAVQREGEVAGGEVAVQRRVLALVPDDHRAAAARLAGVHALELALLQGVVLDRHGEPALGGVERRPLRHRPRAQHAAHLEAQVEVQRGRVVLLDDEPRHARASRSTGAQSPRSRTPSSSKPMWWASSWRTVRVTCSRRSSGSWPKSRRSVSR